MRAAYGLGDQGRLHASTAPAAWGEQLMDDMLATPNASLAGFLPGHIEDTLPVQPLATTQRRSAVQGFRLSAITRVYAGERAR